MKPPLIAHAAFLSQVLPLVAGFVGRRRLDLARKGALTWAALLFATNLLTLSLALTGRNNLWTGYTIDPLRAAVGLWTLSQWQTRPVPRITVQLLIPLFLLAILILTFTGEQLGSFSRLTAPFTSVLLLGVSLYTVIVRSLEGTGQPLLADWFWIGLALALHYGGDAAIQPVARALLRSRPDLVDAAYQVKAALAILISLALARGLLCPSLPTASGGSLPAASSRSSSSSSRSGPRS